MTTQDIIIEALSEAIEPIHHSIIRLEEGNCPEHHAWLVHLYGYGPRHPAIINSYGEKTGWIEQKEDRIQLNIIKPLDEADPYSQYFPPHTLYYTDPDLIDRFTALVKASRSRSAYKRIQQGEPNLRGPHQ